MAKIRMASLCRADLHGMLALVSLSVATEDLRKIQETPCLFCPNTVRYVIDFSLSVASPRSEVDVALLH
jgi:hypothetical protein